MPDETAQLINLIGWIESILKPECKRALFFCGTVDGESLRVLNGSSAVREIDGILPAN